MPETVFPFTSVSHTKRLVVQLFTHSTWEILCFMWVWVSGFINHIFKWINNPHKTKRLNKISERKPWIKDSANKNGLSCLSGILFIKYITKWNNHGLLKNSPKPCYHLKTGFIYTATMMNLTWGIHHTFRYLQITKTGQEHDSHTSPTDEGWHALMW